MKKQWKLYIAIMVVVLIFNVVVWNSTAFCDWYIQYVMPVWINTYGRFMGLFSFSVGEILIIMGAAFLTFGILLTLILTLRCIIQVTRKSNKSIKWVKCFYKFMAWVILWVMTIMSLNYSVLYHGSSFNEKYLGKPDKQYSLEELVIVRNYVVNKCNELSREMQRDTEGDVICKDDLENAAISVMQDLGKSYYGLSGFYPRPKAMLLSDLMCQQYMQGYFFPFSMEANYNDVMYIMNKPAALCHELGHLKGFINEDEANFIAYLACISSSDLIFQYSGYLSVLYYLDNDFYDAIGNNRDTYKEQEHIRSQVIEDNVFVKEEEWKRINEKALVDTEVVDTISDQFTETYLRLNGVTDGMISYSRVVKLLLEYYEGRLF
ncbi:MAG TPA: DUF3810 domain-containing protein [Lachnospiraceae bacterium]|nr:DUF3810 domain-containing protein [Lachnospiraceae bacterium]